MAYQPIFQNGGVEGMATEPHVDRMLGNAYQVVRYVAQKMHHVQRLSTNMQSLVATSNSLTEVAQVAAVRAEVVALYANLTELVSIYPNMTALLAVQADMADLLAVPVISAEHLRLASLRADAALASEEAALQSAEDASGFADQANATRQAIDNRIYPGTSAVDPLIRPDGTVRQTGDRYYNSATQTYKTFNGTVWFDPETVAIALRNSTETIAKDLRNSVEVTARVLRDSTEATAKANRESAAALVLAGIGYAPPVAYAAGISLTLATQTVSYLGQSYAPLFSMLPFTTSSTFEASKFRLIQGVAAVDLAGSGGAGMVGYQQQGGSQSTVKDQLDVFASDKLLVSSNPCYAAIAVNATRTTIDRHAFEDWSKLNTTDTGMGYSSFDAKATLTNPLDQNHFVGYQSRNIYAGAGNMQTYMHGYDTAMVHSGSGTIPIVAGVRIRDIGGSGPVTNNYGLYIDPILRGANKWAVFVEGGKIHFGGQVDAPLILSNAVSFGLNFGVDVAGKSMAYGFGSAGQVHYGTHNFYDGTNRIIATLDKDGIKSKLALFSESLTFPADSSGKTLSYGFGSAGQVNFGAHAWYNGKNALWMELKTTGLDVKLPSKPGSYMYSTLPVSAEGFMAFCTNGRKVGEGAGAGTGVPVYYSAGVWRTFSTDAVVTM